MELGTLLGFIFTLLIFSYLLSDNFLYRLALYVFAGLAAAFTLIVTLESVVVPLLDESGEIVVVLIALVLAGLLLAKPLAGLAGITTLALGFLIAVGAAVAVTGAITGTLLPLALATGTAPATQPLLNSVILFLGVATSLLYFQFIGRRKPDGSAARGRLAQGISFIGEGFIAIALGTLYGAAILSSLTVLTERIGFLLNAGGLP